MRGLRRDHMLQQVRVYTATFSRSDISNLWLPSVRAFLADLSIRHQGGCRCGRDDRTSAPLKLAKKDDLTGRVLSQLLAANLPSSLKSKIDTRQRRHEKKVSQCAISEWKVSGLFFDGIAR